MKFKSSVFFVLLSIMLFLISFAGFEDRDNNLSSSVGIVENFSFGRGGDFSLLIRTESGKYEKFEFMQFRSTLSGKITDKKGKLVRISHYGDFIADCWAGDERFCFSKCTSDRECRIAQNQSASLWLRIASALILMGTLFSFLWHSWKRRH
jgi:hypothetical protein